MLAAGITAVLHGSTIPAFSAPEGDVDRAFMAWCTDDAQIVEAAGDRYLAFFTDHYMWIDTGVGLVLSAFAICGLAVVLRITAAPGKTWLRTPWRRWHFAALGVGIIAWSWAAALNSFETDLGRMYFPWCADSISIPMFETTILVLIVTPILLVIGWGITRLFGDLPVSLWQWDGSRVAKSWLVSIVFGALMTAIAVALIDSINNSLAPAAPALIIALYLLASTRAGLLAPSDFVDLKSDTPRTS